ncbi:MAG TPA: hypothetical protein PLT89_02435 [Syntrophomonadaceae bacterium]|nr:hypothetical protein [Syntrophomonadaceae bacterium]
MTDSKNKEKIAKLQDEIKELQKYLQASHNRERLLQIEMQRILAEIKGMTEENINLTRQIEDQERRMQVIDEQIKKQNSKWKRIIARLLFRMKKLEEQNRKLQQQLLTDGQQMDNNRSKLSSNNFRLYSLKNSKDNIICGMERENVYIQNLETQICLKKTEILELEQV